MNRYDVIVIGGGPAGVSAACELAKNGLKVVIVEQFNKLGGVVYRHSFDQQKSKLLPKSITTQWSNLKAQLDKYSNSISILVNTTFVGVDSSGMVMLENRQEKSIKYFQPKAIIIATGAVERIIPFSGWDSPRVITAGGLQVSMKAADLAPQGDIVLAGNGP